MFLINSNRFHCIEGFEERLGKFELSPDGSLIVFINRNGHLHFVSAKVIHSV